MNDLDVTDLKNISLKDIDESILVDITKIEIRDDLQPKEKMLDFIKKVKNPYCFKIGDYVVKSTFNDQSGITIKDCVENLLLT